MLVPGDIAYVAEDGVTVRCSDVTSPREICVLRGREGIIGRARPVEGSSNWKLRVLRPDGDVEERDVLWLPGMPDVSFRALVLAQAVRMLGYSE